MARIENGGVLSKFSGKRSLGRSSCSWEDNIRNDLIEIMLLREIG